MTIELMFIVNHKQEYMSFGKIPDNQKLADNPMLCGLMYLEKLMKDKTKFEMVTENNMLNLVGPEDLDSLSEKDVIYLLRCGIGWDNENDCLISYKYR